MHAESTLDAVSNNTTVSTATGPPAIPIAGLANAAGTPSPSVPESGQSELSAAQMQDCTHGSTAPAHHIATMHETPHVIDGSPTFVSSTGAAGTARNVSNTECMTQSQARAAAASTTNAAALVYSQAPEHAEVPITPALPACSSASRQAHGVASQAPTLSGAPACFA